MCGGGGLLRPLAPGGEQEVREDEDCKNTGWKLAFILLVHSACVVDMARMPQCHVGEAAFVVCMCVFATHNLDE